MRWPGVVARTAPSSTAASRGSSEPGEQSGDRAQHRPLRRPHAGAAPVGDAAAGTPPPPRGGRRGGPRSRPSTCRRRRGVEGVDRRPPRRPARRRRGLPAADRPLAAGRHVVDAVDDAAVDRRPAGPARAPPGRRRAGRRGAGDRRRATASSAPTRWRWPSSATRLRATLGDERLRRRALGEGAALDGDAAVEHALRALADRLVQSAIAITSAAARRGRRAPTCRPSRG